MRRGITSSAGRSRSDPNGKPKALPGNRRRLLFVAVRERMIDRRSSMVDRDNGGRNQKPSLGGANRPERAAVRRFQVSAGRLCREEGLLAVDEGQGICGRKVVRGFFPHQSPAVTASPKGSLNSHRSRQCLPLGEGGPLAVDEGQSSSAGKVVRGLSLISHLVAVWERMIDRQSSTVDRDNGGRNRKPSPGGRWRRRRRMRATDEGQSIGGGCIEKVLFPSSTATVSAGSIGSDS